MVKYFCDLCGEPAANRSPNSFLMDAEYRPVQLQYGRIKLAYKAYLREEGTPPDDQAERCADLCRDCLSAVIRDGKEVASHA